MMLSDMYRVSKSDFYHVSTYNTLSFQLFVLTLQILPCIYNAEISHIPMSSRSKSSGMVSDILYMTT